MSNITEIPWIEKHRPTNISEIYTQNNIKQVLESCIQNNNLPNLLLYGPSGTGKTSTITAMCRQLFGPVLMRNRILVLNASDDRGINTVREKIKQFANMTIGNKDENYPSPNFKVIILDEADNMTIDAQSALRRIMETTAKTTRFCIICNNINKVIEPISSRCAKFRFTPLNTENIKKKVMSILEKESVNLPEKLINNVINESKGDARKVVNLIQCLSTYENSNYDLFKLYNDITGNIEEEEFDNLIIKIKKSNIFKIPKITYNIIKKGDNISKIIQKISMYVLNSDEISEKSKSYFFILLNNLLKKYNDGCDEQFILAYILIELKNLS